MMTTPMTDVRDEKTETTETQIAPVPDANPAPDAPLAPEDAPVKLARGLTSLLADTYTLYNSTQLCHWNIEGPGFAPLHDLFEQQYRELAEAVDQIAERIRSLGFYTPGSLKEILDKTRLRQSSELRESGKMLELLIESHRMIGLRVRDLQKIAQESGDEASFDLLVERQRTHEKMTWMLESQAGHRSLRLT